MTRKAETIRPTLDQWVEEVCSLVGVDPGDVPVGQLLKMTRTIAHDAVRPGAPISCFIVGFAAGRDPSIDPEKLMAHITAAARSHAQGTD